MELLPRLSSSEPLDQPGNRRWSRAATAQIKHARFVVIVLPRAEAVPVERAQQTPRSDSAHVDALPLKLAGGMPCIEQPAQLRLAVTAKVHLGYGLRKL